MRELARGETKKASEKAKFRLKIFDCYRRPGRFSATGKPNAALTCRHSGIHRSYFYRWKARYDTGRPAALENKSAVPRKRRAPSYSRELVREVRTIREKNPGYSGKKIRPILLRTRDDVPGTAALGRLITRENLFFTADAQHHKKRSKAAKKAHERMRKPRSLTANAPGQVIEFDMKHVYLLGQKQYAFCAIDIFSREALVHPASSPSSRNARAALKKVVARFGKDIKIVNDNGSENMAHAEAYLKEANVTQYWARPYTPKDKPFVERLIGTFQRECLDYNYTPLNVTELTAVTNAWLDKYHFYRPHESLGFLTPAEFSAKLNVSIPHAAGVS